MPSVSLKSRAKHVPLSGSAFSFRPHVSHVVFPGAANVPSKHESPHEPSAPVGAIELGAAEHSVHPADNGRLNVPGAHVTHAVPPDPTNVPAGHVALHAAEPPLLQASVLNRPFAQAKQALEVK